MIDEVKGHVVIVMAPTGSGKGTLIKSALETFPDLKHTISCTTRSRRPGEIDGQDYYFLSRSDFEAMIVAGEFLEWAAFGSSLYGTPRSEILPPLREGKVIITEIELQGVEQLLNLIPRDHVTVVYIESGGWEILRERALARAPMSEEELAARHERYLIEVEAKAMADVIIENSQPDFTPAKEAFNQLLSGFLQNK